MHFLAVRFNISPQRIPADMKRSLLSKSKCLSRVVKQRLRRRGSVFVEYVLLLTIVGIGILVGLASVRTALVNELLDLAAAIDAIHP